MAAREGWTVVGEYHDEGFSAFKGNRGPGLANARAHAARVAADHGTICMLVCQHSDRISRGAGDRPRAAEALIEIWHAERRRNVHLRSVEDDHDLRDSASVANIGERNRADSERKGKSVNQGAEAPPGRRQAGGRHPGRLLRRGPAREGQPARGLPGADADRRSHHGRHRKRLLAGAISRGP
jgi:hypothetical protein